MHRLHHQRLSMPGRTSRRSRIKAARHDTTRKRTTRACSFPAGQPARLSGLPRAFGADRPGHHPHPGRRGNTSIKDGDTLWVKASGTWLQNAETTPIMVPGRRAAHAGGARLRPRRGRRCRGLRPDRPQPRRLAAFHRDELPRGDAPARGRPLPLRQHHRARGSEARRGADRRPARRRGAGPHLALRAILPAGRADRPRDVRRPVARPTSGVLGNHGIVIGGPTSRPSRSGSSG